MKKTIIYKENYQYNIQEKNSPDYFHLDYGTRHSEINMNFQHFHPFYEIYVLLKGCSNHIIEGNIYPLQAFDVVLLKPYALHKTEYLKDCPSQRLILNFSLDYIKKELLDDNTDLIKNLYQTSPPIFRFEEKDRNKLLNLFNSLYLTSSNLNPAKNLKIYSLFLELLYEIYSNRENNVYLPSCPSKSLNKLRPVTSFIHENYYLPLSLETLSKKFFISSYYLSHLFKSMTGFTLTQYIHITRVKKAQQMLMETKLKTIEISQRCGFGSLSQFNRVFKKISKISPSFYRKSYTL